MFLVRETPGVNKHLCITNMSSKSKLKFLFSNTYIRHIIIVRYFFTEANDVNYLEAFICIGREICKFAKMRRQVNLDKFSEVAITIIEQSPCVFVNNGLCSIQRSKAHENIISVGWEFLEVK